MITQTEAVPSQPTVGRAGVFHTPGSFLRLARKRLLERQPRSKRRLITLGIKVYFVNNPAWDALTNFDHAYQISEQLQEGAGHILERPDLKAMYSAANSN